MAHPQPAGLLPLDGNMMPPTDFEIRVHRAWNKGLLVGPKLAL